MLHTVTCAIKSNDGLIIQQFAERLAAAGIKAIDRTAPRSKYAYLDLCWDDALPMHIQSNRKAGAKPRQLLHDGVPATCGLVWQMRADGMSDAAIGLVLDASESTIARRRHKHLTDGDFCKGSNIVF